MLKGQKPVGVNAGHRAGCVAFHGGEYRSLYQQTREERYSDDKSTAEDNWMLHANAPSD